MNKIKYIKESFSDPNYQERLRMDSVYSFCSNVVGNFKLFNTRGMTENEIKELTEYFNECILEINKGSDYNQTS